MKTILPTEVVAIIFEFAHGTPRDNKDKTMHQLKLKATHASMKKVIYRIDEDDEYYEGYFRDVLEEIRSLERFVGKGVPWIDFVFHCLKRSGRWVGNYVSPGKVNWEMKKYPLELIQE